MWNPLGPVSVVTLQPHTTKKMICAYGQKAHLVILVGNAVFVAHNIPFECSCRNAKTVNEDC